MINISLKVDRDGVIIMETINQLSDDMDPREAVRALAGVIPGPAGPAGSGTSQPVPAQQAVYAAVRSQPGIRSGEIAKLLHMEVQSVSSHLQELKQKTPALVRNGSKADGSTHRWWVTDTVPPWTN